MHMRLRATWMLCLALLSAGPSGALAGERPLPPTRTRALLEWLRAGTYRTWASEPAVHPSVTAHGNNVRTWLSPSLVEDLQAGRTTFRRGAAMVKELYFDGQEEVIGYSVMRKVRRRSGRRGKGWFFFETFDGRTPIVRPGRGVKVCVGCHQDGHDYYLSGFVPPGGAHAPD
jgi:hypothetical protein